MDWFNSDTESVKIKFGNLAKPQAYHEGGNLK